MRRGMFGVRPQPNGRCNDGAVVVLRCKVGDGAKNGGKDMLSRVPPGGSPLDFDSLTCWVCWVKRGQPGFSGVEQLFKPFMKTVGGGPRSHF